MKCITAHKINLFYNIREREANDTQGTFKLVSKNKTDNIIVEDAH